ncbi:caspase-12-like isoform X2 [Hippopotamus amphibius kiboko]|uniref:caspase-12-like isoform X2 n=1 Tax=Hippopotamus amphibius kiboko TaxID=575201 RepID=UPI0025951809|nr:caspase-12-like isoform X2 [Hippopotamus amphibius kiboko]
MAEKRPLKDDPVNMVKLMARNVLDGIFDDLMENNVLNRGELQRLGKEVNHIVNRTGDLVDDLTEKTQIAGKIFKDHFFNPKKQLSLRSHPENESDESESTESSSSTESEDESEKSGDEEKVESAQTLALPPTGRCMEQLSQEIISISYCYNSELALTM